MVKTNGILHTSIPYPSLKAFGISFFRIFNAPLRSALINLPVLVWFLFLLTIKMEQPTIFIVNRYIIAFFFAYYLFSLSSLIEGINNNLYPTYPINAKRITKMTSVFSIIQRIEYPTPKRIVNTEPIICR